MLDFFSLLAGLNPNMNVNCMEVGGLSMKEPPQPQSRLSQWTHPNSMDSLSGNSSHMEANLNKHGRRNTRNCMTKSHSILFFPQGAINIHAVK